MATTQVRRLSDVLKSTMAMLQDRADKLVADIQDEAERTNDLIGQGQQMHAELKAANAELQASLGLSSNNPPLDGSDGKSGG